MNKQYVRRPLVSDAPGACAACLRTVPVIGCGLKTMRTSGRSERIVRTMSAHF